MPNIQFTTSTQPTFLGYLKSQGLRASEVFTSPSKPPREHYIAFLKTLGVIEFNREARKVATDRSFWKMKEIQYLAELYKDKYNEDWMIY